MARYIFAFEGLWGYGEDGFKDFANGRPLGNHGGNLLKAILSKMPSVKPGGSTYVDADTSAYGERETILCYYRYQDADKAAEYAERKGLQRSFKLEGKDAYHTVIVIGHSLGGDAAWRFATLLGSAPLLPNLGITFDPRSITDGGWGDKHASWTLYPENSASQWRNYYRPDGFPMIGFPLPATVRDDVSNDDHDNRVYNIRRDAMDDHCGMILKVWNDGATEFQRRIDGVGTARKDGKGDEYV